MKIIRYGPLIVLAMLVSFGVAFAQAPAPFCKAKEYALYTPADEDGDHIWKFKTTVDGEKIRYALMYLAEERIILISREPFVCAYMEDTQEIKAVVFLGYGFIPVDETEEAITQFAFDIFRELVEANALPTLI